MSWNILAQQFSKKTHWTHVEPRFLRAGYRRPQILSEIEARHPTLLCLQECDDYLSFWKKELAARGYETVYKQRNGTKPDGCCVAFDARFRCVECYSLFYDDLVKLGPIDPNRIGTQSNEMNTVFEANEALRKRGEAWDKKEKEEEQKKNRSLNLKSFETHNIALLLVLEDSVSE